VERRKLRLLKVAGEAEAGVFIARVRVAEATDFYCAHDPTEVPAAATDSSLGWIKSNILAKLPHIPAHVVNT
jgi:hypothetical protein